MYKPLQTFSLRQNCYLNISFKHTLKLDCILTYYKPNLRHWHLYFVYVSEQFLSAKKSWISHSRCEWVTWSEINRANKKRPAAAGTSSTTTTRDAILSRRPAKLSSARVDVVQLRTLWTVSELESRTYVRCSVRERLHFFLRSVGRHGVIVSESARAVFSPLEDKRSRKKGWKVSTCVCASFKKKNYDRRVSHFKSVRRVRKVKFAKIYY